MEPPTSYGSLYDKYAVPISSSVTSYDPGLPLVASAGSYTYADIRPLERSYSSVAPEPSSALECHAPWWWSFRLHRPRFRHFDTVAASLPALAAPVAATQASHAALQVAASGYSAPIFQAPPAATQPTPPSHSTEVFGGNCHSSSSGSTGSKGGPALPPCGLPDDPDENPDKNKRDKDIDNKRKGESLIDIRPSRQPRAVPEGV